MAASFSRGIAPRFLLLVRQQAPCKYASSQPTQLLFRLSSTFSSKAQPRLQLRYPSRFLQTTARGRPPPKTAPKTASTTPKPTSGPATTTFADQLALKGRVLLYEAPSHLWYRISSISACVFCVGYSVYHYWTIYLHPPEDLAYWVPYAYGLICVFMASMGAWFVLGTGRVVSSMSTVAIATLRQQSKKKLPASIAARAAAAGPVCIEVSTQRIMPFMPRKKVLVWPDEAELQYRMTEVFAQRQAGFVPTRHVGLKAEVEAARAERDAKAKARQYQLDHILTAPFRDAKSAFSGAWGGIQRAFNRSGFVEIKLQGKVYKLDVSGGWALDNGRAMDRLLTLKANAPGS